MDDNRYQSVRANVFAYEVYVILSISAAHTERERRNC